MWTYTSSMAFSLARMDTRVTPKTRRTRAGCERWYLKVSTRNDSVRKSTRSKFRLRLGQAAKTSCTQMNNYSEIEVCVGCPTLVTSGTARMKHEGHERSPCLKEVRC